MGKQKDAQKLEEALASGGTFKVWDRGQEKEAKLCCVCQQTFTWRKKWERCWQEVSSWYLLLLSLLLLSLTLLLPLQVQTCSDACKKKNKQIKANIHKEDSLHLDKPYKENLLERPKKDE